MTAPVNGQPHLHGVIHLPNDKLQYSDPFHIAGETDVEPVTKFISENLDTYYKPNSLFVLKDSWIEIHNPHKPNIEALNVAFFKDLQDSAAEAIEVFDEDELEDYAAKLKGSV